MGIGPDVVGAEAVIAQIEALEPEIERDPAPGIGVPRVLGDEGLGEMLASDQGDRGLGIHVREDALRPEADAVLRLDARDAVALDLDPGHFVLEQDFAARLLPDRVDHGADEARIMVPRVVGALSVGDDEGRMEEQRDLRGREQVVASLTGEDRPDPGREAEAIEELPEGRFAPAQEPRESEGRRQQIPPGGLLRDRFELAHDLCDEIEIAVEGARLRREIGLHATAEILPALRDPVARSGDDDVVEAVGIELEELDLVDEAELVEEPVDLSARRTAEDVVDLGAEAIVAEREGMRVAAGGIVRLEDDDLAPCLREQRRGAEARHAGADHQVVAFVDRLVHGAKVGGVRPPPRVPLERSRGADVSTKRSVRRSDGG
jgi:hypothetical protein